MHVFIENYWPHILALLSFFLGLGAAIHATMTKQEVRTAIGWVGVIMLSPVLGAVIYGIFGINRIHNNVVYKRHRHAGSKGHARADKYDCSDSYILNRFGRLAAPMKKLGDHVSLGRMTRGNHLTVLDNGDEAYSAMLSAIGAAKRCLILECYIFDRDGMGELFVEALSAAVRRGVEVRVLIDAVGARYSIPSIVRDLRREKVPVAVFNGNIIIGLRLPYANLRTHRKILVVDGSVAFTGGMNIRAGFSQTFSGEKTADDTHFRVEGPAVADIFSVAANDWAFAKGENLDTKIWAIPAIKEKSDEGVCVRVVPTGPDRLIETNQRMLIGAFSLAEKHIRIMTPYLLPDRELISALVTAARRGVDVDIVVPGNNNLKLVDRAMRAQFDQLLRDGCRIWRAKGPFNHSKLMEIDDRWSYVGSSNLDSRSLRLNFEIDMEIFDETLARYLSEKIQHEQEDAREVRMEDLVNRPFLSRLIDRVIWLGSPYL
ncbi:phospholipase D-like domain-containing protein [Bartonella choladocola]|uniref:Phospholipase D n=1 Tax=Bartonella choladocola TaxID=2750995 RepID=A0A1U9MF69_9HYPH|nr:phospholipase D-like domain-containing protein [Bartonella choladocola]AQT46360.1 cardiolipin synthase [Bartonella choladocola]